MRIAVVGTCHKYQMVIAGMKASKAFSAFIASACEKEALTAIGEELNPEELAIHNLTVSLARRYASELHKDHRYCDPTTEERAELGIDVKGAQHLWMVIRAEVDMDDEIGREDKGLESRNRYLATEVGKFENTARELFWYRRLMELKASSALFICGADHVVTFTELLTAQNCKVSVLAEEWVFSPE